MTSSTGGSQNIRDSRTKIPSGGTENKGADQTSQNEAQFSGARVSKVDNLKSRLTNLGTALKTKPKEIFTRAFKNIKKIGIEKKARSQIKKTNLSEDSKEKQDQLNEMLKDHEVMKNCEKMLKSAGVSTKKQHLQLQEKYNVESSLNLLLEIKKQYKAIPKTTKQAKDMIQEFYQLGEDLEKEAKEIFSKINMDLANTSRAYKEKFKKYEDIIKKSEQHIEKVKSDPERLKLAKETLKNSTNSLNAIKEEYNKAIDALGFDVKEEIQKKVNLYSEKTDKIISALRQLPEKQQDKFKIRDLIEKKGILELIIKKYIADMEGLKTSTKGTRSI